MNRYAVHSNGRTSYFNRWNREQHTPLCELGETVQYMLLTVKQFPKPEPRFYNWIWLGKGTTFLASTTRLSEPTTTLTPQGPADTGSAGDYWQFNTQGELVRVHRQYRKTLFTPSRTQCPVPAEQLEDYRKTTIRSKDGATHTFEDKYQTTEGPNKAQPQMWKGEDQERHQVARNATATDNKDTAKERAAEDHTTSDSLQSTNEVERENTTTKGAAGQGIPLPSEVHPGKDILEESTG